MKDFDFYNLSPDERVRLWLAAAARGDKIERRRMLDTSKRSTVTMRELAFQDLLDTMLDSAVALRIALVGPIEIGELLSGLLSPTSSWPEDLDESEWSGQIPRPSVLNQYLGGIADHSIWSGPNSVVGMDDSTFIPSLELANKTSQNVLQAIDALLCQGLLSSNAKAWGIIEGITRWCEFIALSSDDFLTWYCQDLLDRLELQKSTVLQAHERLVNYRRTVMWPPPSPDTETDTHDFQSFHPGTAVAFAGAWIETYSFLVPR